MNLQPIFLKLDSRPGLIVGAGNVALEKLGTLMPTGIRLRVVAPEARPEIHRLAAEGRIELTLRAFEAADLIGQFIVIAATDKLEVNAEVYRLARARGILTNSVDDIPNCDFFFGSVVSRGALQVAISTAGESPAFAQRLRREIDTQLPADIGPWLADLGRLRREILAGLPPGEARKALLHKLANEPVTPGRETILNAEGRWEESPSGELGSQGRAFDRWDRDASNIGADKQTSGCVFLVGAGPGDPELLTVKALRLIQSADVVLHDDLVAEAILDLAAPRAAVVNVGKRCGVKTITQDEINDLMVDYARAGRSVVRLKSGDPLLFGRAAEEIRALSISGIAFEVVPGVSSAFAAAASIGCSLTDREWASNVIFSAGHHAQSHNKAALPAIEDATRVVYMPGRDLALLAAEWLAEGLPADLPCVIVSRAAQPDEEVRRATLGTLGEAEPVAAPSILIAGWAVRQPMAHHLRETIAVLVKK